MVVTERITWDENRAQKSIEQDNNKVKFANSAQSQKKIKMKIILLARRCESITS